MMIAANAGQYQVLTGGAGLPAVSARPRSASAFSSATITVASAAVREAMRPPSSPPNSGPTSP